MPALAFHSRSAFKLAAVLLLVPGAARGKPLLPLKKKLGLRFLNDNIICTSLSSDGSPYAPPCNSYLTESRAK